MPLPFAMCFPSFNQQPNPVWSPYKIHIIIINQFQSWLASLSPPLLYPDGVVSLWSAGIGGCGIASCSEVTKCGEKLFHLFL